MAIKDFPEEGEFVLCTVTRIIGTTVFVQIEDYNREGVVSTSEVAPGRIRNIRDYVTINKKIACKVLRVNKAQGNIDMSLRRVSQKEARAVMEEYKKEHAAMLILKIVLKEKAIQAAERIKEKYQSLDLFLDNAKENNKLLEEFAQKEDAEKILNLIKDKVKEKKYIQKVLLSISSASPNGITVIKNALSAAENVEISYLGAPHYSVVSESNNPKDAEKKLKTAVEVITQKIKAAGGKIECEEEN